MIGIQTQYQNFIRLFGKKPDLWIFGMIIALTNLHILTGNDRLGYALIFLPREIAEGQWYRIITHPFVHISWFHILWDAGAFFLLYSGLAEKRIPIKLLYVAVCGVFSLLFAFWFSPMINRLGLCGLSGIAHGLMAVSGMEMTEHKETRWPGIISFLLVFFKGVYELITGNILFEFLLMGMCGTPMAACHFGGVAGGVIVYTSFRIYDFFQRRAFVNYGKSFVCFFLSFSKQKTNIGMGYNRFDFFHMKKRLFHNIIKKSANLFDK